MSQAKELTLGIAQLGLSVAPEAQQKLLQYLELLYKWNRVYNLTAIRQPEQMVSGHLLDSLAVVPHMWPGRWLDVGCGAGLPGLVLAMACPQWTFTLIDSNSKKTSFVQQAKMELELNNVSVHCGRVESWQAGVKFDGIISRAFTDTAGFVGLTRHLLAQGGGWIAMKAAPKAAELEQLPHDVSVIGVVPLEVPGVVAARCLIMLKPT
ncbi:MAG: 16S rRNA (guanine(527)-N(7))-methyltransferase RsmG [Candidatus Nitrotoga sp.]|nr:16S rRNA (guanine(527)-N(7))-methyltransferase RsmG [Candidatus Nitrotoga sp.]MDW7625851.1 16S rRNA (guanine(527)-N(7))-methyltransferase RsmG [Candidatus Nitrotoga sp.]